MCFVRAVFLCLGLAVVFASAGHTSFAHADDADDDWHHDYMLPSGIGVAMAPDRIQCNYIVDGLVDRGTAEFQQVFERSGTIRTDNPNYRFYVEKALSAKNKFESVATISGFQNLYILASARQEECRAKGCEVSLAYLDGIRTFVDAGILIDADSEILMRVSSFQLTDEMEPGYVHKENEILEIFAKDEWLRVSRDHFVMCWDPSQTRYPCFDVNTESNESLTLGTRVTSEFGPNTSEKSRGMYDFARATERATSNVPLFKRGVTRMLSTRTPYKFRMKDMRNRCVHIDD